MSKTTFSVTFPRISKPPGYVIATCFISVAGWLNGYDTGSAGAVTEMPYFHQTFGELTPFMHGLTVSMILLTGASPSIYAGQLADYVGRLRAIMIGALLFVVGALLQGMAPKLSVFLAGRAIGGIGMGTWMAPQAVYVTEIAPSMRRGMLMATPQLGVVTDRFTRRSITLTGGLILTSCMLLIGSLYASNAITPTSPARFLVISLVFIFGLTYCCTWCIVGKIYASEIQPPQTRSMANCVAQGIGFLTNWLVTILTPTFLAESSYGAYFLFGGFCLTSVVLLWAFMPETKGLSLEGIEEVFNTNGVFVGGSRLARGIRRVFAMGHEGTRGEVGSVISLQDALRERDRDGQGEGMESRTSGVSAGLQQGVPAVLRVETI
ncbi:hypothetical protein KVT40_007539 [Elsinoe batatas]|uniref:Major facilitator superfamily (MFS) profile domain-containing protein n=1 Tax=Elsinoe batatas TaxID=2601811 RepID=A0A8K0KW97_9PEZI|nr:hypothetical protein KVT40_007539 [Elsinoe batatas]